MKVDSRFLFYTYDYETKERLVYLITSLIIPRGIQFNISKFIGRLTTEGPRRVEKLRKRATLKYVMTREIAYRFYNLGSFKIMNKDKNWDNLCVWMKRKDLKSIYYLLLNQRCPSMIKGELKFANLIQVND